VSSDQNGVSRGWLATIVTIYRRTFLGLAALAMAAIVAIMSVQIFFRYVMGDSLIWAEEMCRYLLIIITFLLVGSAFERGDMAAAHFFVETLPRKVGFAIVAIVYLLCIGFLVVISYFGYRYAAFNGNFAMPAIDFIASSLLGRPVSGVIVMYWIYLLIPLGCLLLAAHFAAALVRETISVFGRRETA
jgi:TRAP-type C4-dicarboxylate transport system permease small subunit